MIRIVAGGPHTRLESPLCSACPQGVTGCCASPPVLAWADLGRIADLGGTGWLLDEIAAGRLQPCARGLGIVKVPNPDGAATGLPRKCVYHGERGCRLAHDRRSATCNHYVCDDALAGGSPELRDRLTATYAGWDQVLADRIAAAFPGGVQYSESFLGWLAGQWSGL